MGECFVQYDPATPWDYMDSPETELCDADITLANAALHDVVVIVVFIRDADAGDKEVARIAGRCLYGLPIKLHLSLQLFEVGAKLVDDQIALFVVAARLAVALYEIEALFQQPARRIAIGQNVGDAAIQILAGQHVLGRVELDQAEIVANAEISVGLADLERLALRV